MLKSHYFPQGGIGSMGSPARNPQIVHFADCILDVQTAELRRNGTKIVLQDQPFQILTTLIEAQGRLVTREELIKRLWPSGTFVDFDQSLNRAVYRLREALGDDAEHPQFVETFPRKGYRFISRASSQAVATRLEVAKDLGFHDDPTTRIAEEPARASRLWSRKVGIAGAAAVALIGVVVGSWYLRAGRNKNIESVAVLPFVNMTADPNLDYLSNGLMESLIASLSRFPDLTVRPRASVLRYKGKDVDPRVVAKELKVQAVVIGRVSQQGDFLVVTTELVDPVNNRSLWAERYGLKLSDVLEVEREISLGVSARLREKLTKEEKVRFTKSVTANPEAYQLYLKGLFFLELRTSDTLPRAHDYFSQALARDPAFAQAYVGMADYWGLAPDFLNIALSEALPEEEKTALKAVTLDSDSAPAHLALAEVYFDKWEWANAEREFQRTLELEPNLANAHNWYGLFLAWSGRPQKALVHLERAVELDPLNPNHSVNLAMGYQYLHQYDRALVQFQKAIEIDPNFAKTYIKLADLYQALGKYDLWLENCKKHAALNNHPYRTHLVEQFSRAYAVGGYPAAVRRLLELQKQQLPQTYLDPAEIAYEYASLGNTQETFWWLDKAYAERSRGLQMIQVEPSMEALRSDSRYKDILRRMGMRQ
jgi:TolB-like protein/DNA-binding winged helix-turn-helix (wHTH) protein